MNDYSRRAEFYRTEFKTKEDFPLLLRVLEFGIGPIADIPCGAGRLLGLHLKHNRITYMVDLEPAMVKICKKSVSENTVAKRIIVCIGDIKNWRAPMKLSAILVTRGGIQLLSTRKDIRTALVNCYRNLTRGGILYLDIADPWGASPDSHRFLPEFMRFGKQKIIAGKTTFKLDKGGTLIRNFTSQIFLKHILVDMNFRARYKNSKQELCFKSLYRWCRISLEDLKTLLISTNFTILGMFQDYNFSPIKSGAGRIICIAQKEDYRK